MKSTILFLTNKVPYPPKDGGSIATLGLITAFANANHQTTVLAMNTRKHHITPFEIPANLKSKILFHLAEVPAQIKLTQLIKNFLFSRLPYNAERFIDKNYNTKLIQLLQSNTYDIIQIEGLYLYPYIETIKKYSSAKVVYRSHNIEYEIWERTVNQSKGIKKYYLQSLTARLKKFEFKAINQYDLLVPITHRDLVKLTEMGNDKPSLVVPAGFDTNEIEITTTDFDQNLFFIGALDWSPNQEGLLWFIKNCWSDILKKRPETKLIIAGRNAPDWIIEKFKQKNISYIGEVESSLDFITQNGIMIAPLLSGSGMRVKIIEGMLYQKAIVTTTIGCEGINVDNEVNIFIADSPSQFVSYCLILLKNRNKVIATGKKARNFAIDEFDNNQLYSKLITFFNQHI